MIGLQSMLACPVCFGQSDSPMASAMTMGIFFMLVMVVGVLAGFASFFVHLVRRARLVEQSGSVGAGSADVSGARL
jgi:hypothetical protein